MYHVYDEGGDNLWTVNLNMTDVSKGLNSYYVLQLLQQDKDKSQFLLFVCLYNIYIL